MSPIEDACEYDDLRAELEVTDKLLEERNRLLAAVPACEIHGACVPHAIEWVESTGRYIEDLEQGIHRQAFKDLEAQRDRLLDELSQLGFHAPSSETCIHGFPAWKRTIGFRCNYELKALDAAKEPSDA